MSITERERRNLFDGLENSLGEDAAETLMKMLPDQPADELVTTTHLHSEMAAFRSDIHADFAEFKAEIHGDFVDFKAEIRGEFADFRTEMRGEFADFRTEMRGEFADFRTDVTNDLVDMKGHILRVENSLTLRIADLQRDMAQFQSGMNRWVVGLATTNVAALATALLT